MLKWRLQKSRNVCVEAAWCLVQLVDGQTDGGPAWRAGGEGACGANYANKQCFWSFPEKIYWGNT